MDDKWVIDFQEGVLDFYRSWTGLCMYHVTFRKKGNEYVIAQALANIDEQQSPKFDDDYHVRLLDFLISNLLLGKGKPFPFQSDLNEGPAGAYQHHVAGTSYPEIQLNSKSKSGDE